MRASIRDVAKHAGVSPMTVSNVLRRRTGRISEQTQQRVLQALQDLNYIPIRPAVQNRHVETHAIGVGFVYDRERQVGHQTFQGMCEGARQRGYDLLIILRAQPDWMASRTEAPFLDRRCDGFIFVGQNRRDLSEMLAQQRIPVVECYSAAPPPGVASVLGDNSAALRLAVTHLAELGHHHIAHLAGPAWSQEAAQRREAFRAAMCECGRERYADCILPCDTWGEDDPRCRPSPQTRALLESLLARQVTAVVCANDYLAFDLWRAAEERGLQVPRDLSITGMDNTEESLHTGLTSVAIPFTQIGSAAVDVLLKLLEGGDPASASVVLPVELIRRNSVAFPFTVNS